MRSAFLPALVALCLILLPAAYTPAPVPMGAWLTYTPAVGATSGTITTLGAVSGRYQITGKRVDFSFDATVTTSGTAAGNATVTLPFAAIAVNNFAGKEFGSTNYAVAGIVGAGANTMFITRYDGATPLVNGARFVLNGSYEMQ